MQNANVWLVKAVTPSSSSDSLQHRQGEGSFLKSKISGFRSANCKMPSAEELTKIQQQLQHKSANVQHGYSTFLFFTDECLLG